MSTMRNALVVGIILATVLRGTLNADLSRQTVERILSCLHDQSRTTTQTISHYRDNIEKVIAMLQEHDKAQLPEIKTLLVDLHNKEVEETAQGNYVFYHGRKWAWDFLADMYKHLHNLCAQANNNMRDYVPLRFDGTQGGAFCMNYAIFGNSTKYSDGYGSSSISYLLRNHDYSYGAYDQFTMQSMFARFNLQSLYLRYSQELEALKQLHASINPHEFGSLLMLVVAEKDLGHIYPAQRMTKGMQALPVQINGSAVTDMKKIVTTLKNNPALLDEGKADNIQVAMHVTYDYLLDIKNGPRMYAFNAIVPEQWQRYTKTRDRLFARIRADLARA